MNDGEFTQPPAAAGDLTATNAAVAALAAQLDARDQKADCRLGSTSNLTLLGVQTIDGVAGVAGNRIAVMGQTLSQNNGIYVMAAGAWTRTTDADTSAEVTSGMFFWVTEGTANGDKAFELTTDDPIVLGTTPLTFQQFAGALKTSQVVNDSAVSGATSKDALETLNAVLTLDHLFSPVTNQVFLTAPSPVAPTTFIPQPAGGSFGTATQRVPDNTNYSTRKFRVAFVTAAGANASCGAIFYTAYAGNTGYFSRETGFALKLACIHAAVSSSYSWELGVCIGLPSIAVPSNALNVFFVGADQGDANAQIMYNDGAGTCTKVDLGSNFPARTAGDTYDVLFWCAPGSATINYTVNRHTSAGALFTATGTITGANVPAAGTQWSPLASGHNGTAGGIVAIDVTGFTLAIPL